MNLVDTSSVTELVTLFSKGLVKAELWAAPVSGFSKYVWALAELSFDPEAKAFTINKGTDKSVEVKVDDWSLLDVVNHRDHRLTLDHILRLHLLTDKNAPAKVFYNEEPCYELGLIIKIRQLFTFPNVL